MVPPKMLTGRYERPDGEGCDREVKSWGVGEKRESGVCRSLWGRQLVAVTVSRLLVQGSGEKVMATERRP